MSVKHILSAVPVLPALDLEQTLDYYEGKLGFTILSEYPGYALLERDGAELHFFECEDKYLADNSGCYLRVENIEALHEELANADITTLHPLEVKPWGMKEFSLIDVNGNLLRFGQPAEEE